MKPIKEMYLHRSASGALSEGRRGKHHGTTMLPSAMVKYCKMYNFKMNPATEKWAPGQLLTQYEYTIDIKTFLPLQALTKGTLTRDNVNEKFNRLETVSYWNASYQEILRHLHLGQQLTKMQIEPGDTTSRWDQVVKIALEFKEAIRETFTKYSQLLLQHGDYSMEQYEFYVKEHAKSASPFKRLNEKGEVRGIKWRTILEDDDLLKTTYTVMLKIPQEYADAQAYFRKHEYLLIDIQHAYAALRARRAEYRILSMSSNSMVLLATKTRDRKAGGIEKLSQIEWPIYGKTEAKRKVYAIFYRLIEEISGCKINSITMLGAKFYSDIADRSDIFSYDLRNAEKQVALLFSFMHFNADLGSPKFPAQLAGELYSGVGPTRILNEIAVAIYVRLLISLGYAISEIFIGGDNFALTVYIDCEKDGFSLFFTNEERILGFQIASKSFGPPSLITDNTDNRVNLPKEFSTITWNQNYQHEGRILQYLVQNSLFKADSCYRYLKWVVAKKLDDEIEIYDKLTMHEKITETETLYNSFLDEFSEELNYAKHYFLINNDLKGKSTDAHPIIN